MVAQVGGGSQGRWSLVRVRTSWCSLPREGRDSDRARARGAGDSLGCHEFLASRCRVSGQGPLGRTGRDSAQSP